MLFRRQVRIRLPLGFRFGCCDQIRIRVGVSDGADRFGFGCRRQIRLRLPPTDSASAAADRSGFGCCRQIRIQLLHTDSHSPASDRFRLGCCGQILIRPPLAAAHRFGFGYSAKRLPVTLFGPVSPHPRKRHDESFSPRHWIVWCCAAGRFGFGCRWVFGCCDQIRVRMPLADTGQMRIRIRLLRTDAASDAADRSGFSCR